MELGWRSEVSGAIGTRMCWWFGLIDEDVVLGFIKPEFDAEANVVISSWPNQ